MTPPGLEPGTHWLKITSTIELRGLSLCDPGGTRTHDPLIKSQVLYAFANQLSYGVKIERKTGLEPATPTLEGSCSTN